jgi:hypothetical protein
MAMRPGRMILTGAALALWPVAGAAQDLPPGCSALVTVQSEGCFVRRIWTCETDQPGWRWAAGYGPEGPLTVTLMDADGGMISSGRGPGTPNAIRKDNSDPLDLATLLEAGADSYAYTVREPDGAMSQHSGSVKWAGEVVQIDGRDLQRILGRHEIALPGGAAESLDIVYLHDAGLGLVMQESVTDAVTGEVKLQRRPVEFLLPGEAGADDVTPQFGCGG